MVIGEFKSVSAIGLCFDLEVAGPKRLLDKSFGANGRLAHDRPKAASTRKRLNVAIENGSVDDLRGLALTSQPSTSKSNEPCTH